MKRISIILILILAPFILFSQFKLENQNIKMQQNTTLVSKHNKVLLYGLYMTNQGYSYYPINLFDGTNWDSIPSYFKEDNRIDTLEFRKGYDNIIFGNEGNIWIVGSTNGFYKWNGNKLEKYFLDDNLKSIREYTSIGMDSSRNIWLTTRVTLQSAPQFINYYTELIKYDGQSFEIVADNKKINQLGFSKIFINSTNKVFVTSIDVKNNLLTVESNGSINISTIPTPHHIYNPDRFEQRFLNPISIMEDTDKNIWFALGAGGPQDPGLIVLKNDNTWKVYTEHNNYPLKFTTLDPFSNRDSVFSVCNAITEDKNGIIWVGGTGFLNYIDKNDMLVTPNIEDFLNKSTFYSSEIIADPGKEAPPSQLEFLNSSDSIATIISELFNRDWTTKHTLGKIGNSGGRVESMTTTEDGSIWIAFLHIGVLRYQPSITNIEDISVSQEINLYPQPITSADKLINIEFEKPEYISSINIYNLNGKLLQRKKYDTQITDKIEMRLDNNDFIAGTYIVAIELKNKAIFRKFIIN